MSLGEVIPVLRIFDVDKAKAFFVYCLGFTIDFEHRFEPELPAYMQISRDACTLHLSEHHGDGSPGIALRIATSDVGQLHGSLTAKDYPFLRPDLHEPPRGGSEMMLTDPFGNRLTFYQPT